VTEVEPCQLLVLYEALNAAVHAGDHARVGALQEQIRAERERLYPPGRKFTEDELRHGLSRERKVELVTMFVDLGAPKTLEKAPGTRGPKFKKNQYKAAAERRAEPYRRLAKAPRVRLGTGYVDKELILRTADDLRSKGVPERGLPRKVARVLKHIPARRVRFVEARYHVDESTVRKVIRKRRLSPRK